ncbi:hypothetical protein LCGC14_0294870 [marine sediment metagenome]|uniref:Tyrosine specific protein phosphatases domain-containing protein n=1 Tax=marine sediment metagenome TaxID=412755 RepID=A0A0F9TX26_9ZZZZ
MNHTTFSNILLNRLWMSGELESSPRLILEGRIHAIVNLSHYDDPDETIEYAKDYLHWPIDDGPLPNLDELGLVVYWATQKIREGRRVLIHCDAGLNRSGLVTALVVMEITGMTGTQAISHVRVCRGSTALFNPSFTDYLETLGGVEQ